MPLRHLGLVLLYSWTISVYMQQRSMKVVFSANYSIASVQGSCSVGAGT
jgi:hypothetical protein